MSSNPEIARLITSLRRTLHADRLAHAYLLSGRSRSVLLEAAGEIMALLYCDAPLPARPCGTCVKCRQAREHAHPDLLWIEPQSKSRRIVMEQIAQVREQIGQTTFDGGWKSVVLVDADRLQNEAANTLLKTLEEPPPSSLFLLLTDSPSEILTTIASRCQRLTLNTVDPRDSREGREIARAVMNSGTGAGVAGGIMRARFLYDRLQEIKGAVTEMESEAIADVDPDNFDKKGREKMEAILAARIEAVYRGRRETVLEWLLLWQRDLLMCLNGVGEDMLNFTEDIDTLRDATRGLTCRRVLANIRTVEDMQTQLGKYLPETTVFEHGFITMGAPEAEE